MSQSIDREQTEGGPVAACANEAGGPKTRLRASLLRRDREPVEAFRLIGFGPLAVDGREAIPCVFDREQAAALVAWFDGLGRRLAIDYEHQSVAGLNTRPDGLSPAAGWIGGLEVRSDGLWAVDVEWTERARTLLRRGEYRYYSPVLIWSDAARERVAALGPVALTNDPALRGIAPLAASHRGAALSEPSEALADARRQIDALQRTLSEERATRFVDDGLRSGKILESTQDDWRTLFLAEPRDAEARLRRAPVLLPPGRVTPPAESAAQAGRLPGHWIEDEDLAAFERVDAAGHVRVNGTGGAAWH